jgi:hypothetical protein
LDNYYLLMHELLYQLHCVKSGRTTRMTRVGRGFRCLFHRHPLSTNPMKSRESGQDKDGQR